MDASTRRILICLHDFSRGGTERIAIGLAKSWAEAGRDVTLLCGAQTGGLRDLVDPRVAVVALDPPVPRSFFSRLTLGRAMGAHLAALRPDLIFLPGNFHFFLATALRRADPRPVIVAKISNPLLPRGVAGWLLKPLLRHAARAIDGFAAMTSGNARDLAALLPSKRVALLPDPIYVGPAVAEAPPIRRDGVCNILWAGRLEPQKDVGLALRTIQKLAGQCPAHLTILGDGSLRAKTLAQIQAMDLTQTVTWLGHVSSLDPYFPQADVLLMTSHYEGNPAVAGEALAHGLPLVSTDCCYMLHDVMTRPDAGRIVATRSPHDLAAALLDVCRQPRPARADLAALVAHFAPRACAQAYLDWFDLLVRERAS